MSRFSDLDIERHNALEDERRDDYARAMTDAYQERVAAWNLLQTINAWPSQYTVREIKAAQRRYVKACENYPQPNDIFTKEHRTKWPLRTHITPEAKRLLAACADDQGGTMTNILEMAIRVYAKQLGVTVPKEKN